MKNQEQEKVPDERQEERAEKKPYGPPMLERLGSLKHVTKGIGGPVADVSGLSW